MQVEPPSAETSRQGTKRRLSGTFRILLIVLLVVGGGVTVWRTRSADTTTTSTPTSVATSPATSVSTPSVVAESPSPAAVATVVWADEFDGRAGAAPDAGKWTAAIGGTGWGNSELQYYTDRRVNAQLDGNGNLAITALADGRSYSCWYGPCRFTSARLTTKGKFSRTYGRFEARIKISGGQGVWPAFWLLGENIDEVGYPQSGEIDVMENIGREPYMTHGALHGPGFRLNSDHQFDQPVADDFHVFAVDWSATGISYSVDGETFWTQPRFDDGWVFDQPFHIVLNMAIGGWAGEPGDTTFPRQMLVDYVRVFAASTT